jgi:hypothetical protein
LTDAICCNACSRRVNAMLIDADMGVITAKDKSTQSMADPL